MPKNSQYQAKVRSWRAIPSSPPARRIARSADQPLALYGKTEAFVAEHGLKDCISVGSSLKFCMLAEGAADIYPASAAP